MKTGRKWKVWVFTIALCLLCLAGCGESADRSSEEIPEGLQLPNEPVEITTERSVDPEPEEDANGFLAEYVRWHDGERIKVDGNQVQWVQSAARDDSYESFVEYLKMVFCYAGTLSMETESEEIDCSQMRVGDVFLKGGSPGHVVMVIDICENEAGQRAFLLGQGYMPAQEFHVLKNPQHEEDCWYYEEEITYPFCTPEYTFRQGSCRRLNYSCE